MAQYVQVDDFNKATGVCTTQIFSHYLIIVHFVAVRAEKVTTYFVPLLFPQCCKYENIHINISYYQVQQIAKVFCP